MSDTIAADATTVPPLAERMPDDWNHGLRWPPIYAIYDTRDAWKVDQWNCQVRHIGAHSIDQTPAEQSQQSFDSCQRLMGRGLNDQGRYKIMPMPWKAVEEHDYASDGNRPVWYADRWWLNNHHIHETHHVRRSDVDPTMLSYFISEEKAARNIRTRIRPGKYLTRYFKDILNERQIASFAHWQSTGERIDSFADPSVWPLTFAGTGEEIEWVYVNGPRSCMSGSRGPFMVNGVHMHPVRAYAAGDLAVAHLRGNDGNADRAMVRALCWPERKVFGRIYPSADHWRDDGFVSGQECREAIAAFTRRMREQGFVPLSESTNGFEGARLALLKVTAGNHKNLWLMPFIDASYGLRFEEEEEVDGKKTYSAVMSYAYTEVACQSQSGYLEFRLPDNPYSTCFKCVSAIMRENDVVEVLVPDGKAKRTPPKPVHYCRHCSVKHSFHCAGTRAYYAYPEFKVSPVERLGMVSDRFLRARAHYVSALSGLTFMERHNPPITLPDGSKISDTEFAGQGFVCATTGKPVLNKDRHPIYPNISIHATEEEITLYVVQHSRPARRS